MSGRRDPKTDEKAFVADIARSLHIEKAVAKAGRIEKRNASDATAEKASSPSAKKRARKSGGSVWITFKGGFSAVPIVADGSASATAALSALTAHRGATSEAALIRAVAAANAYMESAREQAAEAGLHCTGESAAHAKQAARASGSDVVDYAEGDAYLKEQRAIAAKGVQKALSTPCGAHLRALVAKSASSSAADVPSFATKEAREAFEDAVAAARLFVANAETDAEAVRAPMYFSVGQRQDSQVKGATSTDGGNTLCIVKSKVSGAASPGGAKKGARRTKEERGKKGTVIFRTRAKADAFVQSFMNNVIRKEMSSVMRIRDGTGHEPSPAAAAAAAAPAQQSQKGSAGKGKKGRR